NTAPTPGAAASSGAATGAGAHGAHAAQASGMPAIFQAMLATLAQAEDAATAGAASAQVNAGGKLVAGAVKTATAATADDGKTQTKTKTANAADGQTTAATAANATVTPDAAVALVVPAVAAAPAQVTPQTGDEGDETGGQVTGFSGKALAGQAVATPAQNGNTGVDADKVKASAALEVDGAALNASANVKTPAAPALASAQTQTQAQPQAQAETPTQPAPTIPASTDPASAGAQVPPATLAAAASTTPGANANAKTSPNMVAIDSKTTAPKVARADAPKAPTGVADTNSALSANTAGKNADALAPIAGGVGGKTDAADKDGAADSAAADSDQPTTLQASGDPTTASTTTPATVVAAAAAAVRGSPQTVANLAAQIVKKLDARSTQFDVQLDPAGLGKVDVRLQIGADGKMTAAMSFDTPQAAAELRSRSNELQQALAQSGFDISGGMSFDVASDRGQGGQAQNQQPEPGAAFRGRAFQAALDTTSETLPLPLTLSRTSASGVDIRI
ncbi:MAG: flagellar hook-length control protein FliK, partial [Phenylobacterium sp.]